MSTYKYANALGLVDRQYISKEEWLPPEIKPRPFLTHAEIERLVYGNYNNPVEEAIIHAITERKKKCLELILLAEKTG